MRALMLEEPGTPPRLSVVDLPVPRPGPGEALVRVAACGFCRHDLLVMNGTLRRGVRPGTVLGHEIAGVVEDIGEGVSLVSPRRPRGVSFDQRLRPLRPVPVGTGAPLPERRGHRPRPARRICGVRCPVPAQPGGAAGGAGSDAGVGTGLPGGRCLAGVDGR